MTSINELSKLDEGQEQELVQQARNLKQTLKRLSKNQLIQLLVEQVNHTIEQQNINKILLQENKELKK